MMEIIIVVVIFGALGQFMGRLRIPVILRRPGGSTLRGGLEPDEDPKARCG